MNEELTPQKERFLQEVDRKLRTVIQTTGQVKEYMRIFERAPALKAVGLEDTYKVLADFGDAVLAGQLGKKGAKDWRYDMKWSGGEPAPFFRRADCCD